MEKIKRFLASQKGKDILVILIVFFVGIGSFSLGKLSAGGDKGLKISHSSTKTHTTKQSLITAQAVQFLEQNKELDKIDFDKNNTKKFFASSRGKKYYPLDCSAGKSIKASNRVYFESESQAQSAGYELSSSCK